MQIRRCEESLRELVEHLRFQAFGSEAGKGTTRRLGVLHQGAAPHSRNDRELHRIGECVHARPRRVVVPRVVEEPENPACRPRDVRDASEDVVGRVQRHELLGGDQHHDVGVVLAQRDGEASAHDVAQDVVEHHVVAALVEPELLELRERAQNPASCATDARLRSTDLDAVHAMTGGVDHVLQQASVEPSRLVRVEHRPDPPAAKQQTRRVVLRVATDLQHSTPFSREGRREVRGDHRLADSSLAVDRDPQRLAAGTRRPRGDVAAWCRGHRGARRLLPFEHDSFQCIVGQRLRLVEPRIRQQALCQRLEGRGLDALRECLDHGLLEPLRLADGCAARQLADHGKVHCVAEPSQRGIRRGIVPAVQEDACQPAPLALVARHPAQDVVRRVDRHELLGGHEHDPIGVVLAERNSEASADHVAEHVVDDDVEVRHPDPELVEQLEGAQNAASGAPDPGHWTARLHAPDAAEALVNDLLGAHPLRNAAARGDRVARLPGWIQGIAS